MNFNFKLLRRYRRSLILVLLGFLLQNVWSRYRNAPVTREVESLAKSVTETLPLLDYAWGSAIHRFQNHPELAPESAEPLPWRDKAFRSTASDSTSVLQIWIVTQELSGLHQNGGIGTAYLQLAKSLASEARFQVTILLAQPEDHFGAVKKASFLRELSGLGVKLHFLPSDTVSLAPEHWAAKTSIGIYRYLKPLQRKIDIIHFHDNNGLSYYSALARFEGLAFPQTRFVVGLHGPEIEWAAMLNGRLPESDISLTLGYLEKRATELADVVVSPSHYMVSYLIKHGWNLPAHRFVIPNLSDLDLHSVKFGEEHLEPVDELVYFGRLEERKGIRIFFEALDIMLAQDGSLSIKNITLLGRDRTDTKSGLAVSSLATAAFDALQAKYHINSQLTMQTNLDQHRALHYLSEPGRLAIMPSLADNSPGTVLECIVHAIPFLSSNVGGTSELILPEDRDEVLFLPTAKSLAQKLAAALNNHRITHHARPSKDVLRAEDDFKQLHFWLASQTTMAKEKAETVPLVSVIISHYQRPHFLRQLLGSLALQNYINIEVLVIDDGSANVTVLEDLERIKGSIMRPRGWQLYHIPNSYLGEARDFGAFTAKGDYYLFLDDDDVLKPEAIQTLVEIAQTTRAGTLSSFLAKFAGEDNPLEQPEALRNRQDYWFLGQAVGVGLTTNMFGSGNIFMTKEAFQRVQGFSTYRDLGSEDWEIYMKLALNEISHYVVPEALLYVREDSGRHSMKYTMDQDLSAFRANTPILADPRIHALDLGNTLLMARKLHSTSRASSHALVSSATDFRPSQGWNGWYYTFQWADAPLQLDLNDQTSELIDGRWTYAGANYTKPYITELEQYPYISESGAALGAIRSFRNPSFFEGVLQVEYTAHHPCGDGTELQVVLQRAGEGSEPELLWSQLTLDDGEGFFTNDIVLDANDVIHMAVYPLENDDCDLVRWQLRLYEHAQGDSTEWVPMPSQVKIEPILQRTFPPGEFKLVERQPASIKPLIEVAFIFDQNRLAYARQVVRSIVTLASDAEYIFHLVTPPALTDEIRSTFPAISSRYQFYDYALCEQYASLVTPFSSPDIHLSAHCKLFLPSILHPEVSRVLYLDNDITVLSSLQDCWSRPSGTSLIAMAIDMGDVCQSVPSLCWPMPAEWQSPFDGLAEPVHVNGGVMLMNLARMRAVDFEKRYVKSVAQTYASIGKLAKYGEQDFINSYFRLFPQDLDWLACGCNYQYRGNSREAKCSGEQISIAHAWRSGAKYADPSPYSEVFDYFVDNENASDQWSHPPLFPLISPSSEKAGDLSTVRTHLNCPHQEYDCSQNYQDIPYTEPVWVLAEAFQADQWTAAKASIQSQRYSHVKTLLATSLSEDQQSNATVEFERLSPADAQKQLCNECGHLSSGERCDSPMDPEDSRSINDYWSCVCSIPSSEEQHFHTLLSSVSHSGWILYLPASQALRSPNSIAHLLAQAKSTNEILLFSNTLTPYAPTKRFEPNNVEGIGLMHHSSNMWYSRWNSGKKCGEWRTLTSLSSKFPLRWVDDLPVVIA